MLVFRTAVFGFVCLLQVACVGDVSKTGDTTTAGAPPTGGAGGGDTSPSSGIKAAPGRLRRLTNAQFARSLQLVLGKAFKLPALESDGVVSGFASVGASVNQLSPRGVEQYEEAIVGALEQLFADAKSRDAFTGCKPSKPNDDVCAKAFVGRIGRLAWRRPLLAEEVDRYAELATSSGSLLADGYRGLMIAAAGLLQSPNHLYRVETGQGEPLTSEVRAYSSFEMSTRLAFLLTGGPPDETLLKAASAGELATTDGIRKHAERLLAADEAKLGVHQYLDELLTLGRIVDLNRDAKLFPAFSATLKQAMVSEVQRAFDEVVFKVKGDVVGIISTTNTFLNEELAALYGISGVTGAELRPVALTGKAARAGLLGMAGILALHSKEHETSPSARGAFIRRVLMCEDIPDPPAGVMTTLAPLPQGVVMTKRQQLDQHRHDPSCASCHALMDPPGYALEKFDAMGALRTLDNGLPIDASGELEGKRFDGLVELSKVLVASPKVAECFVRNVYRYATGRAEQDEDEPSLKALFESFESSGRRLDRLLVDTLLADGVRFAAASP